MNKFNSVEKLSELDAFAEALTLPLPEGVVLEEYDEIHCNFSGGFDSLATVLLLVHGYKVSKEKILLVHMRVDSDYSQEQLSQKNLVGFDWPETDQYLEYCAAKLGIRLVVLHGEKSMAERIMERGSWPAPGIQYCTSYLKRDVYAKWCRRKGPGKYLCCTGVRAQESARRAKKVAYELYKPAHSEKKKRYVGWLRLILHLNAAQVRELARLAGIEPHPCYQYVSRCSCRFCIFLSPEEMKRVAELYPKEFSMIQEMEKRLGHTMKFEKGKGIPIEEFIKRAADHEQLDMFDLPCLSH